MPDLLPTAGSRLDFWLRLIVTSTVCVALLALIIVPMFREPSHDVSALNNTAYAIVGLLIGNIVKPLFPGSTQGRSTDSAPTPAPDPKP